MSCLEKILVLNGDANTAGLIFGYTATNGTVGLWDFGDATRFTLTIDIDGTPMVIDTDDDPGVIADAGNGELTFDLGALSIPAGKYIGDLRVFNPEYTTGYLLHSGDGHTMQLDVR